MRVQGILLVSPFWGWVVYFFGALGGGGFVTALWLYDTYKGVTSLLGGAAVPPGLAAAAGGGGADDDKDDGDDSTLEKREAKRKRREEMMRKRQRGVRQ